MPTARQALDLKKIKLVDSAIFSPQQAFDSKKLEALKKRKDLSPEETKFVLKMLVWQGDQLAERNIAGLEFIFFWRPVQIVGQRRRI